MLKKIKTEQLVAGMYIKAFCGSWMEHPFWRNSFLLDSAEDLHLIHESSIREVWIDTELGRDVGADEHAITVAEANAQVEALLAQPSTSGASLERIPTHAEFQRAARICNRAKSAMKSIFGEARMGRAVDCELGRQMVEDISDSVLRSPNALINLARIKNADEYTFMHSVAVCALMVALARQLGLDERQTRQAGFAGLFHDVGKALIPLEILNKPGKLTEEEFNIVKTHPARGHALLSASPGIDPAVLDVCLHHHEKTDGSGYPKGDPDERISLFAKMGAVCDVYDAITSNRPYKKGWDPAESLHRMAEWADGHFDPRVFQAFVKAVGIYPIGALVMLKSGRLGVITDQSARSLLTPRVKVFFSVRSNAHIQPTEVDLSIPGCDDRIVSREDPAKWAFTDLTTLWAGASV